jgi:hypothetical protein
MSKLRLVGVPNKHKSRTHKGYLKMVDHMQNMPNWMVVHGTCDSLVWFRLEVTRKLEEKRRREEEAYLDEIDPELLSA